ncbi:hypothetical protein K474DRAFT_1669184 [Panus rudis PR-1116 ss-1]|nr:hypothetical protein K474DRAFT_1669184 [Panus rudis PR-1116 ss-1]
MHRCLYISDILPNICDYVMQDGKNESRAAVAYLAQTCSCFYEPAMNTLWRTLNSLVPLFFCLPKETWKMNEDGRLVRPCMASQIASLR